MYRDYHGHCHCHCHCTHGDCKGGGRDRSNEPIHGHVGVDGWAGEW